MTNLPIFRHSPTIRAKRKPRVSMEDNYIPEPNSGCWLWIKALDRHGYGQINVQGKTKRAHRIVFEQINGPIPAGLVLDHKCRVRSCVNPDHTEPVTPIENLMRGIGPSALAARQTHCINGHEFNEENTRKSISGRQCRACDRDRQRNRKIKINLPVVRNSFCNPYIWGWHRFLYWEHSRRGGRY